MGFVVLRLYENIRVQVDAERGLTRKFMTGKSVKEHAADLREELVRRRLQHAPIEWHRDMELVRPTRSDQARYRAVRGADDLHQLSPNLPDVTRRLLSSSRKSIDQAECASSDVFDELCGAFPSHRHCGSAFMAADSSQVSHTRLVEAGLKAKK